MKVLEFIKTKWKGILILVLLLQLIVGTALPVLAEAIRVQPPVAPMWEIDGSDTQLVTLDDIDFGKYKAIAMLCDNGATLPAAPSAGQWYLHTPTGRTILYQYDGSNWGPIISIGTMTIYVDSSDGTDDLDYGTAVDSDAFATIQYAVDCIPGSYGGSVTININGESYTESVTIRGKYAVGDYTITLQGILSSQEAPGTDATVTAGSGATQGTVAHADFNGDDYADMLVYFEDDDEYRVIDSHATTTLTTVGTCPSGTNQEVTVYDWGTTIVGTVSVMPGQLGVYLYDIKLDGATARAFLGYVNSYAELHRCFAWNSDGGTTIVVDIRGYVVMYYCVVASDTSRWIIQIDYANGRIYFSKVVSNIANCDTIRMLNKAQLYFTRGSIIDGTSKPLTSIGVDMRANSVADFWSPSSAGYCRIRNLVTGIYAYVGSMGTATATVVYTNCDTNEDDVAASYGYID